MRAQHCNSYGYVCVDAKFYRGFPGYSMLNLNFADTDTTRVAHAVDMVIDFRQVVLERTSRFFVEVGSKRRLRFPIPV